MKINSNFNILSRKEKLFTIIKPELVNFVLTISWIAGITVRSVEYDRPEGQEEIQADHLCLK